MDFKIKWDSVEEYCLVRRFLGFEDSSDVFSDEGNECVISMFKMFDEKLWILLDVDNIYGNKENRVEV